MIFFSFYNSLNLRWNLYTMYMTQIILTLQIRTRNNFDCSIHMTEKIDRGAYCVCNI